MYRNNPHEIRPVTTVTAFNCPLLITFGAVSTALKYVLDQRMDASEQTAENVQNT